jgi:hypothetical protein
MPQPQLSAPRPWDVKSQDALDLSLLSAWLGHRSREDLRRTSLAPPLGLVGLPAPCLPRHSHGGALNISPPPPPLPPREPTLSALHPCQLILDGGVRRGVDIAKALALGADGVAIGKPYLYGLAAGGRVGVHKVGGQALEPHWREGSTTGRGGARRDTGGEG